MTRISKAKKARKANLNQGRFLNPRYSRQLRPRPPTKAQKKTLSSTPSVEPQPSTIRREPEPSKKHFDVQEHLKKARKRREEKAANKVRHEKHRMQAIKAGAWTRSNFNLTEDVGFLGYFNLF